MAQNRIYYAVQQLGIAQNGTNTFTSIKGLQSLGINTTFNLEQVFEIGQIAIYENIENIPDIEVTTEKVLDGTAPIYLQATYGAPTATLSGRSNVKSILGLSIYNDTQDSASGTPLSQCTVSGCYVSSVAYSFTVDGNSTESVTLVANNKVWDNTFTATAFNNNDSPLAAEGVNRREDFKFGTGAGVTRLPLDIPGIGTSGWNTQGADGNFAVHVQSIRVSANLGREQLFELGRKGPYFRYVTFPVEVTTEIDVISTSGDFITAREESANLSDQIIFVATEEGTQIDLGSKNKLSNVTYGNANAGQGGGNATATYTYTTYNDMTVRHPQDPTVALRP